MKMIRKLSLIILIVMMMFCNVVYAETNCKVDLQMDKSEYTKGNEIVTYIKLSNVNSEMNIISIRMILEYDKDSLELMKLEGQNNWETPVVGGTYNEEKGIIAITKGAPVQNDENVLKLTFKVKDSSKQNIKIELKDISVGGASLMKLDNISKDIIIKAEASSNPSEESPTPSNPSEGNPASSNPSGENPTPSTPSQGSSTPSNQSQENPSSNIPSQNNQTLNNSLINNSTKTNTTSNSKAQSNGVDKSVSNGKLPQTGYTNIILIVLILIACICSVIFYIKRKKTKR